MFRNSSLVQSLAWFFAFNFLFIVALSHWPGLTDEQGRLMGLFVIDPIDDIFHLLSGLAAVVVALHSHRWSVGYFRLAGIPYLVDAATGLIFGRQFLNGEVFRAGLGSANLTLQGLGNNGPHILIPATMLFIGFVLSRISEPEA